MGGLGRDSASGVMLGRTGNTPSPPLQCSDSEWPNADFGLPFSVILCIR